MARFAAAMILHGGSPADLIAHRRHLGSDRRRQIALRLHDLVTLRPHRPDTVQDRDHGARIFDRSARPRLVLCPGARAGILRRRSGVPLPPGTLRLLMRSPVPWGRSFACVRDVEVSPRCRGPGERRRGRGVGAVGHMGQRLATPRGPIVQYRHSAGASGTRSSVSRAVARRSATPPGGAASLPGCDRCRPRLRGRGIGTQIIQAGLVGCDARGIGVILTRPTTRRRCGSWGSAWPSAAAEGPGGDGALNTWSFLATAATPLSPIVSALPAFITLRDNGCSRATAIQEDAMAKWSDIDPAELASRRA